MIGSRRGRAQPDQLVTPDGERRASGLLARTKDREVDAASVLLQSFKCEREVFPVKQVWYVAQLKPSGERLAEHHLVRQGFEVFSPRIHRTTRRQRRLQSELRSLFPGYLFVRSAPDPACWRSIGGTIGVSRLLSFGGNAPSAVPSDVMNILMEHSGVAGYAHDPVKEGDLVRVVLGPLSDLVARVDELPSRDRICVLLDFMGQRRRISMDAKHVLLESTA